MPNSRRREAVVGLQMQVKHGRVGILGGFDSYNFDYSRDFAFVQIGAETPSNLHRSRSVSDCKCFCGAQAHDGVQGGIKRII
jgi:hypothetical protein